jgi:hypothetical protein
MVIDWGNTPLGSTASIYWPQVQAIDVIRSARLLYGIEQFSLSDAHTLQCKIGGGLTYLPIPTGVGENFAGLLTIDLPPNVVKGQEFNIVVRRYATRRVSSRASGVERLQAAAAVHTASAQAASVAPPATVQRNWRYAVGTFQIKIPVASESELLAPEETTYAILLWRLGQLSATSRWYPVMLRYVDYIGARVNAMGGNTNNIKPSPHGVIVPSGGGLPLPSPPSLAEEHTGKIIGVVYDRFGDFDGFFLLTETGHERRYHATESEIEELARFAWIDRVVVSVLSSKERPERPVDIVLRRAPKRLKH